MLFFFTFTVSFLVFCMFFIFLRLGIWSPENCCQRQDEKNVVNFVKNSDQMVFKNSGQEPGHTTWLPVISTCLEVEDGDVINDVIDDVSKLKKNKPFDL